MNEKMNLKRERQGKEIGKHRKWEKEKQRRTESRKKRNREGKKVGKREVDRKRSR